ncbi:protein HEAT INTOLERANT 4 [Cocos nucifera]|uniref:Protein HEAT INTOLERANT 4 n=1 Tax=Cocos nucifera TaxID=13894 RepID=A0A8K0I8L7_COCNU|nr:protein HEAT INTOLERANT 4 [Cocos nucifera]
MRRPKATPRGRKRKTAAAAAAEAKREEEGTSSGGSKSSNELPKESKATTRGKRIKAPKTEPEFFPEKRNLVMVLLETYFFNVFRFLFSCGFGGFVGFLGSCIIAEEDLWQAAFPVGTEWDNMDKIREISWNFSNLEKAFEEGGELYGKKVYLFGCTEAQLLDVKNEQKIVLIPIVVAVVSPIPPSDKIGIKSVQRETEEIIPMKAMKMAWVPYIPLEDRSALKHLKIERVKQYDYCLPYFQPLKADEDEDDTVVNIMFPLEPPVVCDFDWELDDLEEFTDELIKDEALPNDQKDAFKEYVKEQVRERKRAQRQVKEARKKAIEDMDPETRAAFENMRFYKFYPVQTPDTPDTSNVKVAYINRYYGKAHFVM